MKKIIGKLLGNTTHGRGKRNQEASDPWYSRAPRVQLVPLHHVAFKKKGAPAGEPLLRMTNLSATGLGFAKDSAPDWPKEGGTLSGQLVLGEQEFDVTLKIVYITPAKVGGHFIQPPMALKRAVEQYFDLELAALNLDEVRPELLKPEPNGQPHWFIASDHCELFYVEKDGRVSHFHLHFFGTYMETDESGKLRYGKVDEGHTPDKPSAKESALIQPVPKPDVAIFEAAVKFVRNIEKADPLARETICNILSQAMWEE